MKKLKIEKYINDQLDESFTVPVAFIGILNTILPDSALTQLNQSGFDLDKIITASKQNEPYQAKTAVEEKGLLKQIVITLQ